MLYSHLLALRRCGSSQAEAAHAMLLGFGGHCIDDTHNCLMDGAARELRRVFGCKFEDTASAYSTAAVKKQHGSEVQHTYFNGAWQPTVGREVTIRGDTIEWSQGIEGAFRITSKET